MHGGRWRRRCRLLARSPLMRRGRVQTSASFTSGRTIDVSHFNRMQALRFNLAELARHVNRFSRDSDELPLEGRPADGNDGHGDEDGDNDDD